MESGLSGLQFAGQMTFSNCYAIKKRRNLMKNRAFFRLKNPRCVKFTQMYLLFVNNLQLLLLCIISLRLRKTQPQLYGSSSSWGHSSVGRARRSQ